MSETFWFYNLDNGRPDAIVNREIAKILATKPLVLVGAEAVGLKVAHVPGYRMIRDQSTKSRANIVVFVRRDAHYRFVRWIDLKGTWPRTKYAGVHEPRSFPVFEVNGLRIAGVHLPPRNAKPRLPLQLEAIRALARVHDLDIAIGDFNSRIGDVGPGPDMLGKRIGGRTVGKMIDCAVVASDLEVKRVRYPKRVGPALSRVACRSDHGHAFRFTLA